MPGNKFSQLHGFISKNICRVLKLSRCLQWGQWLSFPHKDGDGSFANFHTATGKSEVVHAQWYLAMTTWNGVGERCIHTLGKFSKLANKYTNKYQLRISNRFSLTNLKQKDSCICRVLLGPPCRLGSNKKNGYADFYQIRPGHEHDNTGSRMICP